MRVACRAAIVLFILGSRGAAPADEPAGDAASPHGAARDDVQAELDEATARRVDRMIAQLGALAYADREDAQRVLEEIGPPAFEKLRQAYHATDDLEVKLRIEDTVRQSYMYHHLLRRNGFLGVQLLSAFTHREDPRIAPGHIGQQVTVLAGLPAERAGLHDGDVVIAVDGQAIRADGIGPNGPPFGEEIRVRGAGGHMTLTVLRHRETLTFDVTLVPRPVELYQGGRGGNQDLAEQLEATREALRLWWHETFRRQPAPNEAAARGESTIPSGP